MANLWNTAELPTTVEVNGYTVTLESKGREQASATRTRGLQTLYFGTIADAAGNVTAIEGKPLSWIKKRVGDDSVRCYTRCTDGLKVRKVQSEEEIDSSVNTYRAKCERQLEELAKLLANGCTDGANLPNWWHNFISAGNIAICEATTVKRGQLETYNREQQERAIAHAEQSKKRALSAELQKAAKAGDFVKVSQIAQELAQMK